MEKENTLEELEHNLIESLPPSVFKQQKKNHISMMKETSFIEYNNKKGVISHGIQILIKCVFSIFHSTSSISSLF